MIVDYDENGYATGFKDVHDPGSCAGQLCDMHGRFGPEPWASWPRNWREDRGIMEMVDPRSGIGHPTPAQVAFWGRLADAGVLTGVAVGYYASHGCDGGCRGAFDDVR